MASNVTISIKDFCDAMRRSLELEADLLADRKELELQAKASGINVSAAKKWLKAEVQDGASESPKKVAKLIEQTVDQVVYGESLGHDLGILQNNQHREDRAVENISNPEAVELLSTVAGAMQTDAGRKALTTALDVMIEHEEDSTRSEVSPPPASDATGDTAALVSPTHFPAAHPLAGNGGCPTDDKERDDAERGQGSLDSESRQTVKSSHAPDNSTQDARSPAKSCAEGGASYALASPVNSDEPDLPEFLDRRI